jgi:hypothetical protein
LVFYKRAAYAYLNLSLEYDEVGSEAWNLIFKSRKDT